MTIKMVFDFHDIFVDAKGAWILAFRQSGGGAAAVEMYESGVPKRTICKKLNLDYDRIEQVYRSHLHILHTRVEFAKVLSKYYSVEIVSCSDAKRLELDMDKFSLQPLFSNVHICESSKMLHSFLVHMSQECDWLVYFNHTRQKIEKYENLIYMPIVFEGDISAFANKSFTEHAKNKVLYNELSAHYMDSIANDTAKECQFILEHAPCTTPTVLDCCCGVGRHAFLLAQNGCKVTGFDIAEKQIETANKIHQHYLIEYLVMDARKIALPFNRYDLAICMWTTYNYLSQEYDLHDFLYGLAAHLRPGGILILDSKNLPALPSHRLYTRKTKREDFNLELLICKRIVGNIQNSQYFYFIDNPNHTFYFDEEFVRFYTIDEIRVLTIPYFEIVGIYGDFNSRSYNQETSERFILKLKRTNVSITNE